MLELFVVVILVLLVRLRKAAPPPLPPPPAPKAPTFSVPCSRGELSPLGDFCFHSNQYSPGNNITQYADPRDAHDACQKDPACVAFTTDGFTKSKVLPASGWELRQHADQKFDFLASAYNFAPGTYVRRGTRLQLA